MSHLDPELAALIALGEDAGPGREHLAGCAACQAQVDELAAVVAVARDDGALSLAQPPPELWDRIAAAAGLDAAAPEPAVRAPVTAQHPVRELAGRPRPGKLAGPWWRRRPLAAGLAGAAAGLIIGIGGAAGIHELTRPAAATVVATIPLRPLAQFPQWQGAHGTAVMASGPGGRQVTVALTAPRKAGFYEVWLLARNGVSMISLGDLNASHTGRFTMPPGVDLTDYSRIDISLQPFNGSTQHARTSVVRGTLP
jgi:Anti-sigma-K factor rskA